MNTTQSPELQTETPLVLKAFGYDLDKTLQTETPLVLKAFGYDLDKTLQTETPLVLKAFGYDLDKTLQRLHTDIEFRTEFLDDFSMIQETVQKFKKAEKDEKAAAREKVRQEKKNAQLERCRAVVGRIFQDVRLRSLLTTEGPWHPGCIPDEDEVKKLDLEGMKAWVQSVKENEKKKKAEIKEARQKAVELRIALKAEKEDEKKAKNAAKRMKLLAQLPKLIEQVDYEPDIDEENISFEDLKQLHHRLKMLTQLQKYSLNVEDIPDYEGESIEYDELKTLHARTKLINQYNSIAPDDARGFINLASVELDNIKEMIQHRKDE